MKKLGLNKEVFVAEHFLGGKKVFFWESNTNFSSEKWLLGLKNNCVGQHFFGGVNIMFLGGNKKVGGEGGVRKFED